MHTNSNISIQNISLSFGNNVLFDNFTLSLRARVWSCLLGPSGVGKSTLLKLIARLLPNENSNDDLSSQIAYMGQKDLLLPWSTVLDNTLLSHRLTGQYSSAIKERAVELLTQVGLKHVIQKYPHELSGGMCQRVALIRTLIQDKPIVLMDEPFSSVDAITRYELQTLSSQLLKNHTVLLITHDPLEALRLASDIYVLSGQPVKISKTIHLDCPTPRNLFDNTLLQYQTELFEALTLAKDNMQ